MHTSLLTLAVAVTIAAPVPKAKEADLYFPIQVGTKRVMERKRGNQTSETTESITKVEIKDGEYSITLERSTTGFESPIVEFTASSMGVWVNLPDEKPIPLLKLPAKEGDTWTNEMGANAPTLTCTVGKEGEVTVPAGKYTAIRVDCVQTLGCGRSLKFTTWFAPGIGIIKEVLTNFNGVEQVDELKSFTLGKAEPKKDK